MHRWIFLSSFDSLDTTSTYCLPNNLSLEIGEAFESSFFNYVRISFEKCVNGTSDEVCQPPEVLNEILNSGFIALFIQDHRIETREFTDFKKYCLRKSKLIL